MSPQIKIDIRKIEAFCKKHHISKLSIFGSVLGADFRPESDIDVLVEFSPGHTPGFDFFGMEEEISKLMGRRVDLNTPNFLSRYFRDQVLSEAKTLYEAAA